MRDQRSASDGGGVVRKFAIAAIMLLAACGQKPPVRIPVAVTCIDPADVPEPVPLAGTLPTDARAAADILGSIVLQLRANERVYRALLDACRLPG